MAVPLRRNNPPPEQLFRQGAKYRWTPEPDVTELPDAATLYPIVCEHTHKDYKGYKGVGLQPENLADRLL
eukprot:1156420-Pelagomonas_calceolata.AAC.5